MSEQDSESNTTGDDTEESETHQVRNVLNNSIHDQANSSEDENDSYREWGAKQ